MGLTPAGASTSRAITPVASRVPPRPSAPRRQDEAYLAQRRARQHPRPQPIALGQGAIVLGAQPPVGGVAQVAGAHHQVEQIGLAIGHVDQARLRQLGGQVRHPRVPFAPAHTLLEPRTGAVGVFRLPRPPPGIHDTQRLALRGDGVGRVTAIKLSANCCIL